MSSQSSQQQSDTDTNSLHEYMNQLPKDTRLGPEMVHYQGFWIWAFRLRPIISFQTHFQAQSTDIFITGIPKTGNTWLKSLVFSVLYRDLHPISDSPLLVNNPHQLVPALEIGPYTEDPMPDLDKLLKYGGSPRLLSTHLPYQSLPQSMKDSSCRIIYICRNPLDTFVSAWFFHKQLAEKLDRGKFPSMEEYFELYLQGLTPYGPFFDHVLGYWKLSLEMSHKVLFLKYEELLEHTTLQLKKIADFIDHPFSQAEEQAGIIEEIIKLCSFKNLRELKVNKEGKARIIDSQSLFRKGEIGDWVNYLTSDMIDRMHALMHQKIDGLGLPVDGTWF